jgi:hypothetical protein
LDLLPPCVVVDGGECGLHLRAFGGVAGVGFVRSLDVLLFLFTEGFLSAPRQGLPDAGGNDQGLPQAVVEYVVDSV